jgi:hypothetical protein
MDSSDDDRIARYGFRAAEDPPSSSTHGWLDVQRSRAVGPARMPRDGTVSPGENAAGSTMRWPVANHVPLTWPTRSMPGQRKARRPVYPSSRRSAVRVLTTRRSPPGDQATPSTASPRNRRQPSPLGPPPRDQPAAEAHHDHGRHEHHRGADDEPAQRPAELPVTSPAGSADRTESLDVARQEPELSAPRIASALASRTSRLGLGPDHAVAPIVNPSPGTRGTTCMCV